MDFGLLRRCDKLAEKIIQSLLSEGLLSDPDDELDTRRRVKVEIVKVLMADARMRG